MKLTWYELQCMHAEIRTTDQLNAEAAQRLLDEHAALVELREVWNDIRNHTQRFDELLGSE